MRTRIATAEDAPAIAAVRAARWRLAQPPPHQYVVLAEEGAQAYPGAARRFYERLGATNVGHDVWLPPDGGAVPKLRYAWKDPGQLRTTP